MQNTFLCRLLFHNSDNSYNVIDLFYIPVTICAIATIIYVAKRMILVTNKHLIHLLEAILVEVVYDQSETHTISSIQEHAPSL
jgi:hypothetical protein